MHFCLMSIFSLLGKVTFRTYCVLVRLGEEMLYNKLGHEIQSLNMEMFSFLFV